LHLRGASGPCSALAGRMHALDWPGCSVSQSRFLARAAPDKGFTKLARCPLEGDVPDRTRIGLISVFHRCNGSGNAP
jgi:hypothetical protein